MACKLVDLRCGWRISEKGGMIHHQEIFRAGGITRSDHLSTRTFWSCNPTLKNDLRTFRLGEEFDNTNDFYEGPEVGFNPTFPIPIVKVQNFSDSIFTQTTSYQISTMTNHRWLWWPVTSLEASPWCPGQPRGPRWPLTGWFVNITITPLPRLEQCSQISLEPFGSSILPGERKGDGGHLHGRDQHGHLLLQAHPWYCGKVTSGGVLIEWE